MGYTLNNEIAKRKIKSVYQEDGKTIKLFVENYSKADILNEALNQSKVAAIKNKELRQYSRI